ncbi:rNA polymerase sporulation-specific sigma factor [Firmicutes bacterium CAG:882]|jgi:RNA polymerase sporulation-specific sigma factor|nr:rNA polymerase sporulation-specific sigma factor [Firmicutes bacterium CAG:882]
MGDEKKNYKEYSDELLVDMARHGDEKAEDFLLKKYKDFVRSKARAYFLVGGDSDDLIQEGMIGLYNAISHYDESKASSFMTYAAICINNKLLSAVSADNRKKNEPLNGYVSLYSVITDDAGEEASLSDVLPDTDNVNPENIILNEEQEKLARKRLLGKLSRLEKEILSYYLEGMSYSEIAAIIGKTEKSVDNAIQRIRSKMK